LKFWTKKDLYENVDNLLEELDISRNDYPLDSISIAKKYCINLHLEELNNLDKLCGILFKGKYTAIALNANHSNLMKNFDCMHELIHYFLHEHKDHFQCICPNKKYIKQISYLEWQANEGAAQALVPYQIFIPKYVAFSKHHKEYTWSIKAIRYLSDYFQVSESVIEKRIENLKYEIFQYFCLERDIKDLEILSFSRLEKLGLQFLTAELRYCDNCYEPMPKKANYCIVCGKRENKYQILPEGMGYMIYKGIEVNNESRVFACANCGNEEVDNGNFCNICGKPLINICSDNNCIENIESPFDESFCNTLLPGNARYCHQCGKESSFFKSGLLKPWDEPQEDTLSLPF